MGQGPGDLMVSPKRVVFEGNKLREEIRLINRGSDTAVYAISLINYRMTPEGDFERITEPDSGQYFAKDYVRFFPRRVQLPPNEAQVIRMQVRRSSDMGGREYRSHLYFRAESQEDERARKTQEEDEPEGISIQLRPIYGVTIPVIVRMGDLEVNTTIDDISLDKEASGGPTLDFALYRNGERSVYGDINVLYKTEGENSVKVGGVTGVAVYTPNRLRRFSMSLSERENVNYDTGNLIIEFEEQKGPDKGISAKKQISLE